MLGEAESLPIDTHSIDIVIMPHTLEFEGDPHQVLREAARVLKPEGIILLMGFNPWAFWHVPRFLPQVLQKTPWNGRFISRRRIADWLKLLNFEIEVNEGCCLFPLLKNNNFPNQKIKSYYYYKIGRWDLQLLNDKVIKFPDSKTVEAIQKSVELLNREDFKNYNIIDLRIHDKIIVE